MHRGRAFPGVTLSWACSRSGVLLNQATGLQALASEFLSTETAPSDYTKRNRFCPERFRRLSSWEVPVNRGLPCSGQILEKQTCLPWRIYKPKSDRRSGKAQTQP